MNSKYAIWFILQLLLEKFLTLRRNKGNILYMYTGIDVKYPLFLSNLKLEIFITDFRKMFKYQIS